MTTRINPADEARDVDQDELIELIRSNTPDDIRSALELVAQTVQAASFEFKVVTSTEGTIDGGQA